jgi:hypothetical protein
MTHVTPFGWFFVAVIALAVAVICARIRDIVNYFRANARFVGSVQTRDRIQHLIATTNDQTNSTLLESRQMIETDAQTLPPALRRQFIAGLHQNSIGGRINYTRRVLTEHYLPNAAQNHD